MFDKKDKEVKAVKVSEQETILGKPKKKRVDRIPVKVSAEVTCALFPGIPKLEGENGSQYFERVTKMFTGWLEVCLVVEGTTEVL